MYIVILLVIILSVVSLFTNNSKASKHSRSARGSYTPWDVPNNGFHDGGHHSFHSSNDCGPSFGDGGSCGGDSGGGGSS
jgi:hypothetical protein